MAKSSNQRKAEAAWDRIEAIGGHGVWEREAVVVSLANTAVTDDDLSLFRDFPNVQILDLSHTGIGDVGLAHLAALPALEKLIVTDPKISRSGIEEFRRHHPAVTVTTESLPAGAINPFTGKPF